MSTDGAATGPPSRLNLAPLQAAEHSDVDPDQFQYIDATNIARVAFDQIVPKDSSAPRYHCPLDSDGNYICFYQGCERPIVSHHWGTYHKHLQTHSTHNDHMITSMLRERVDGEVLDTSLLSPSVTKAAAVMQMFEHPKFPAVRANDTMKTQLGVTVHARDVAGSIAHHDAVMGEAGDDEEVDVESDEDDEFPIIASERPLTMRSPAKKKANRKRTREAAGMDDANPDMSEATMETITIGTGPAAVEYQVARLSNGKFRCMQPGCLLQITPNNIRKHVAAHGRFDGVVDAPPQASWAPAVAAPMMDDGTGQGRAKRARKKKSMGDEAETNNASDNFYQCPSCQKRVFGRGNLKSHQAKCTGRPANEFATAYGAGGNGAAMHQEWTCPECHRRISGNQANLRAHMQSHYRKPGSTTSGHELGSDDEHHDDDDGPDGIYRMDEVEEDTLTRAVASADQTPDGRWICPERGCGKTIGGNMANMRAHVGAHMRKRRKQMIKRYGAEHFVRDAMGQYRCFFAGCHLMLHAGFIQHIEHHEADRNGSHHAGHTPPRILPNPLPAHMATLPVFPSVNSSPTNPPFKTTTHSPGYMHTPYSNNSSMSDDLVANSLLALAETDPNSPARVPPIPLHHIGHMGMGLGVTLSRPGTGFTPSPNLPPPLPLDHAEYGHIPLANNGGHPHPPAPATAAAAAAMAASTAPSAANGHAIVS